MRIIAEVFRKISKVTNSLASKIDPQSMISEQSLIDHEIHHWVDDNGDKTLRLTYCLDENSLVFDVGGYEGQWSSDIYSKYLSKIFVFEPVHSFSENIIHRFSSNPNITVFPFGLGNKNQEIEISLNNNGSSTINIEGDDRELVKIICVSEFIKNHGVNKIDLMKINIEGGEFDLLFNLLETGEIRKIRNIQVQFHEFVNEAIEKRKSIQELLKMTHVLTYEYPFVWENWELKEK
jgi:FkbM family methyltransferase